MRFSFIIALLALPALASAIPTNSSPLDTRDTTPWQPRSLAMRTKADTAIVCTKTTIKNVRVCVCVDIETGTCYKQDDKGKSSVVTDVSTEKKIKSAINVDIDICEIPKHAVFDDDSKQCCAYKCKRGYKKCGDKCINPDKHDCVSGIPKPCKPKGGNGGGNGYGHGYGKRDEAATCARGFTACPAEGSLRSYECLNTRSDVESCGGCMIAPFENATLGQDCTAIPHVNDVSCTAGKCQVASCTTGFIVDPETNTCVFSETAGLAIQKYRL